MTTAVIGCGYFGRHHAAKFEARSDLCVVCDRNADNLGTILVENEYVARLRSYENIIGVQAVSICTPAETHYEIASHFLDRGIHVLLEKPFTGDVGQAMALDELARKRGVVLQAGYLGRFSPAIEWVQTVIQRPFNLECVRKRPYSERGRDVSVVMDLMSHDIDLALTLADSRVVTIMGDGDYDEAGAAIVFEDGSGATFQADRKAEEKELSVSLDMAPAVMELKFDGHDMLDAEISSFLKAVRHGKPRCTAQDAINVIRIAKAIEDGWNQSHE